MALIPINQDKYIKIQDVDTGKIYNIKSYFPNISQGWYPYGYKSISNALEGYVDLSHLMPPVTVPLVKKYRFLQPDLYKFEIVMTVVRATSSSYSINYEIHHDGAALGQLGIGYVAQKGQIYSCGFAFMIVEGKHYILSSNSFQSDNNFYYLVQMHSINENWSLEHWFGEREIIETGYPGTPSNGGGGGGSFTTPHDAIKPPTETPDIGELYATKLCRAYVLNNENLISFANSLWTNATEIGEYLRKLISNPMDAIIHLFAVPYNVPSAGNTNIIIGGYNTGAQGGVLASSFSKLDCGTIKIDEFWGNALDYTNTKMNIFLPFIGEVPLGKNCIGAEINVTYHIENSSGNFICFVSCYKNGNYWIESKHSGNCAIEIPLTAQDFHYLENVFSSAGNISGIVTNSINGNYGAIANNSMGLISQAINMGKGEIKSTGTYKGNIGALDNLSPYITIYKAVWQEPEDYSKFNGYPSNITAQLSELKGYTEVDKIHLDGVACTEVERKEIEDLLKSGVIL